MTFTTRPTLEGTFGMVSSTHWLASQSAQRMLELGGNAFDAAVAGGFVLHVVEPHLNGPGGDLPAIVATAADPTPRVLCGQGPAPAGATPEAYAAMGLDHVPGSGPLAAAVPGAVDAWLLLLRDHGSLPLATVLEPAIGYARDGHPLLARVAATIDRMQDLFRESWTTSADLWLGDGRVPRAGELFANPVYASVLERLVDAAEAAGTDVAAQAQAARDAWGHGFVAEAVEAFRSTAWRHSGGEVLPGLVGGDDLAAFSATWEEPVTAEWHGVQVAKTDLWGQGPALLQVLAMLDVLGPQALDPSTAAGMHAVAECWKLAMADREAWFGDRSPVSVDDLLAADYVAERAALVGAVADLGVRPGAPGGREPRLSRHVQRLLAGEATGRAADVTTGEPTVQRDGTVSGDTCHIDVVDRWGNIISATPSGGWLQSSPTIPELGFCLGSRAQMFWLDEGLPVLARARSTPADDAHADPRPARRRARPRLRITGRRPAGPVAVAVPAAPRRGRDGAPAGDRRPDVPQHQLPGLVPPARDGARRARRRGPHPRRGARVAPAAGSRGHVRGAVGPGPDVCGEPRPLDRRAAGRRQPARHAGVRRRALVSALSFVVPGEPSRR